MEKREQLLQDLLEFKRPLERTMSSLADYPIEFGGKPVPILRKHFMHAIKLYLNEEITAERLEEWANALEMRDDLVAYDTDDAVVHDTLFDLANPVLQGEITEASCLALLAKLVGGDATRSMAF